MSLFAVSSSARQRINLLFVSPAETLTFTCTNVLVQVVIFNTIATSTAAPVPVDDKPYAKMNNGDLHKIKGRAAEHKTAIIAGAIVGGLLVMWLTLSFLVACCIRDHDNEEDSFCQKYLNTLCCQGRGDSSGCGCCFCGGCGGCDCNC